MSVRAQILGPVAGPISPGLKFGLKGSGLRINFWAGPVGPRPMAQNFSPGLRGKYAHTQKWSDLEMSTFRHERNCYPVPCIVRRDKVMSPSGKEVSFYCGGISL